MDLQEQLIGNTSISYITKLNIIDKIDTDLNITGTLDPEVKMVWYPLLIKLSMDKILPHAESFVSTMGRMKYLVPIYEALLYIDRREIAL
jgi:hypothetical protein